MKTIFKIAAIAAITALAVISCSPPELPEAHNDYWDQYNDQYDTAKYTNRGGNAGLPISFDSDLTAYDDNYTGVKKDNTVTISFPDTADVLKKSTLTTSDLNFISFYTYNATAASAAETAATSAAPNTAVTSLNELQGWSLDRRSGNIVVVKLPAIYKTSSRVVIKIDSSKYTYSNGLKIDIDYNVLDGQIAAGNGIAGEKGYDDIYATLDVRGITNNVKPVLPGSHGWTINLSTLSISGTDITSSGYTYFGKTDTTPSQDIRIADGTFANQITASDYESIIKALVGGFKVESFSGGNWSKSVSGSIDDTSTSSRIIAKGLSATHNTAYRVVFEKGSISLETTKEFYGLKQRIKITGVSDTISENALSKKTRVEGRSIIYINSTKRSFDYFGGGSDYWEYPSHFEDDKTKPTKGYWKPGYIKDPTNDDDFDIKYNLKDGISSTDDGFDSSDPNNYKTGEDYRPRADNPNNYWNGTEYVYLIDVYEYTPSKDAPIGSTPFGWKWSHSSDTNNSKFTATEWDQIEVPDQPIHHVPNVFLSKYSYDKLDGNIVLKLQLNNPIVTTGSPSVSNYFKEIDATAFKNNFKIYSYSPVNQQRWIEVETDKWEWVDYWVDPGLKGANDVFEIGIDKVEFKLEGLVSTTAAPVSGKNVIYITLDPNYRQDKKIKSFYIGDGIGYADGVTIFSSSNIWDDKGFKGYPVSGAPANGNLVNGIF